MKKTLWREGQIKLRNRLFRRGLDGVKRADGLHEDKNGE